MPENHDMIRDEERQYDALIAQHSPDCRFRLAAACAIGVECVHGFDVCPTCDPCTCSVQNALGVKYPLAKGTS